MVQLGSFGGFKRPAMFARFTVLASLGLLAGFSGKLPRGSHTLEQFAFITTHTTIHEVTNRLGLPDAITGSGVARFEDYLRGRSRIRIWPSEWGSPSSSVVLMEHGANVLVETK